MKGEEKMDMEIRYVPVYQAKEYTIAGWNVSPMLGNHGNYSVVASRPYIGMLQKILEAVISETGESSVNIRGRKRHASVSRARAYFFKAAHDLTPSTNKEIALWLGNFNHTSVCHAVRSRKWTDDMHSNYARILERIAKHG